MKNYGMDHKKKQAALVAALEQIQILVAREASYEEIYDVAESALAKMRQGTQRERRAA